MKLQIKYRRIKDRLRLLYYFSLFIFRNKKHDYNISYMLDQVYGDDMPPIQGYYYTKRKLYIITTRPGLAIGKGGRNVIEIEKYFDGKVHVSIIENYEMPVYYEPEDDDWYF